MCKNSGFSLIEMMIVIAIAAILAGLVVPNYVNWRLNQQLNSATNELVVRLHSSRAEAIKTNSTVTITFPTFEGVTLTDDLIQGGGNSEAFNSMGLPTGGSGSIRVTNGSRTYQISLTVAGAIRVDQI